MDGGLIGWGIAELFHRVCRSPGWVFFSHSGDAVTAVVSGMFGQIFKRLEAWAKRVADEPEMRLPERAEMKSDSILIGNLSTRDIIGGFPA